MTIAARGATAAPPQAWVIRNVPAVLPVDVATDLDGSALGVASGAWDPRNFSGLPPYSILSAPQVAHGIATTIVSPCRPPTPPGVPPIPPDAGGPMPPGRVVALAFDPAGNLIIQTREPSMLLVGDRTVSLPGGRRRDTGHELFHLGTAGGIACASCHPEGHEDGHVWNFAGLGARRTQSISGGILGSEPFHWSGDMSDFRALSHDVFNSRMSGPSVQPSHVDALANWIHKIPRLAPPTPSDEATAERGRAVFNDPIVGCATCHAGAKMTNNATMDVRTGGPLQVPSLMSLAYRAPFMHSGCAPTLADRFGPCGGGDGHGQTSGLTKEQQADLIAYLETL